ncbi:MAG: glycosyltransferase [Solirubrobacterales bacterium]|nr:glycosyltransferase [Solirubrobacterales bacterium]
MRLESVAIAPVPPTRLAEALTAEQGERFAEVVDRGRRELADRVIWNVNSTARGGGVAEMLRSLLAYARGAGLDARWVVMRGDRDFFAVTKRVHNMLHGEPGDGHGLTAADGEAYLATARANADELAPLIRPGDFVLLHDPQTAGLIEPLRAAGAHVVWRCHVGTDAAGPLARAAWDFLLPHVREADAVVFSRHAFVWDGLDHERVAIVPPSIDPFSPKNQDLEPAVATAILQRAGIAAGPVSTAAPAFTRLDGTPGRVDRRAELVASDRLPANAPALLQVSRWDRLKDPLGLLDAFRCEIAPRSPAHLVLAGPSPGAVADDPEGLETLHEVTRAAAGYPRGIRARLHLCTLPMDDVEENAAIVNALQRRAQVVIQKSLAEGFGLTVAEAMWKARPVVASAVGGIREQIVEGETGLLVAPTDHAALADAAVGLLEDPVRAAAIGERGRESVRAIFLGARHLGQYLDLFERLLGRRSVAELAPLPPPRALAS